METNPSGTRPKGKPKIEQIFSRTLVLFCARFVSTREWRERHGGPQWYVRAGKSDDSRGRRHRLLATANALPPCFHHLVGNKQESGPPMSIDSNEIQQLFSSIVSLVESHGLQDKQTPAARKIECRWMIASVLAPKTSGDRKADAPLLEELSGQLNSRYGRGLACPACETCSRSTARFPTRRA